MPLSRILLMKYKLVDLGRPKCKICSTAYLVTPTETYMVKGGQNSMSTYLYELARKTSFFGQIKDCLPKKTLNKTFSLYLVSNGFILRFNATKNRKYYEFVNDEFNVTLLQVRRLPNKWPKELDISINNHLLVASDYCEEKGLQIAANVLRGLAAKPHHNIKKPNYVLF